MNRVTLERFCYSDFGTFGLLHLPDGEQLATVERPWLDNKLRISCIPIGDYKCEPRRYNKGGYNAVEICDVPGRTHILFHIGNYVRNSNGCVLVNSYHGAKGAEWCGTGSRNAFNNFMRQVGKDRFNLSIINRNAGVI